jgi:hypothetical protein
MFEAIFIAIVTSMIAAAATMILTIALGRKPILDSMKETLLEAMQNHNESKHRNIESHVENFLATQIKEVMMQHERECRAKDHGIRLAQVEDKLEKISKLMIALYIQGGGAVEDLDRII